MGGSYLKLRMTESGEPVYYKSRTSFEAERLTKLNEVYFEEELEELRILMGKPVWLNRNSVTELFTEEKGITVPTEHIERAEVTEVVTESFGFLGGAKSDALYLRVKKPDGRTGLLPNLPDYYYINDPILPAWPKAIVEAVKKREIFIGMPSEAAKASWGKPKEINTTVTANTVLEQWVFGDFGSYVYIRNGKVESWQSKH